jgi:DDE superfamily endonuclease
LRIKPVAILDLYSRTWEGSPLKDDEFVISADEKTSVQAGGRKHPTRACGPRGTMQVEHEYFRYGA